MSSIFDNDAEIGVLSILLKNPHMVYDLKGLKSYMFSSTPNKTLFSIIEDLALNNIVPEINLLLNVIKAKNLVDNCGGEKYLEYLINQDYKDSNLANFEKLVIDSYKARSVLKIGSQVPLMVEQADIDSVISSIRETLDNLSVTNGGESATSIKTVAKSAWDELIEKVKNPDKVVITSGFKKLDAITGGFSPGDVWVIAARPSMGKSALMCNSALYGAENGNPQLIFSLEMSRNILIYRLLSIKSGIPVFNIRMGLLNQSELDLLANTISYLKDLPIYIDTNFFSSIDYVISTARKFVKLYGIKVLHLDYIQLLVERGMYSTHELGQVSRMLKLFSNDVGIASVIYSQLNRDVERRDDKRPVLSDIRQSGNIEEDADLALFLYRDIIYNKNTKYKDQMELLIRKHRNGPVGVLMFKFDENTNRVLEG